VLRASLPDRVVLALGGRRWLRRGLSEAVDELSKLA
jgi:hypothetical protein